MENYLDLPEKFLENIRHGFGEDGIRWLDDLPGRLEMASQQWGLRIGRPMLLSYNYVAEAFLEDGTPVVLKVGVPHREFRSELAALRLFDGVGCVRLLLADDEHCMFVMERLLPGEMLVSLLDDAERTGVACDVMQKLWRPIPQDGDRFIMLEEWFDGLRGVRKRFAGGTGPIATRIFERVEGNLPGLFASTKIRCLMHGDFHHYNVLSSDRGWLAIDPKGVVGPAEYECGPLLLNPYPDFAYLPGVEGVSARRIAFLSERLGFEREVILEWGICHAVLSAWWDTKEDGSGGEYSLALAAILDQLKL